MTAVSSGPIRPDCPAFGVRRPCQTGVMRHLLLPAAAAILAVAGCTAQQAAAGPTVGSSTTGGTGPGDRSIGSDQRPARQPSTSGGSPEQSPGFHAPGAKG